MRKLLAFYDLRLKRRLPLLFSRVSHVPFSSARDGHGSRDGDAPSRLQHSPNCLAVTSTSDRREGDDDRRVSVGRAAWCSWMPEIQSNAFFLCRSRIVK